MITVQFNQWEKDIEINVLDLEGGLLPIEITKGRAKLPAYGKYQIEFKLGGEEIFETLDASSHGPGTTINYESKRARSLFDRKFGEIQKHAGQIEDRSENLLFFLENRSRNGSLEGGLQLLDDKFEFVASLSMEQDRPSQLTGFSLVPGYYYLSVLGGNDLQPIVLVENRQRTVHLVFDQGIYLLDNQFQYDGPSFDLSMYYETRKLIRKRNGFENISVSHVFKHEWSTKIQIVFLHRYLIGQPNLTEGERYFLKNVINGLLEVEINPDLKILAYWTKLQFHVPFDLDQEFLKNIKEFELSTSYMFLIDLSIRSPEVFENHSFRFDFNTTGFYVRKKRFLNKKLWDNIGPSFKFEENIDSFLIAVLDYKSAIGVREMVGRAPRTIYEQFISYGLNKPLQILISIMTQWAFDPTLGKGAEVAQWLLGFTTDDILTFNDRLKKVRSLPVHRKFWIFIELSGASEFSEQEKMQIVDRFWIEFDKAFEPENLVRFFNLPAHIINAMIQDFLETYNRLRPMGLEAAYTKLQSDLRNWEENHNVVFLGDKLEHDQYESEGIY